MAIVQKAVTANSLNEGGAVMSGTVKGGYQHQDGMDTSKDFLALTNTAFDGKLDDHFDYYNKAAT